MHVLDQAQFSLPEDGVGSWSSSDRGDGAPSPVPSCEGAGGEAIGLKESAAPPPPSALDSRKEWSNRPWLLPSRSVEPLLAPVVEWSPVFCFFHSWVGS